MSRLLLTFAVLAICATTTNAEDSDWPTPTLPTVEQEMKREQIGNSRIKRRMASRKVEYQEEKTERGWESSLRDPRLSNHVG